jgi:hypothetical protein
MKTKVAAMTQAYEVRTHRTVKRSNTKGKTGYSGEAKSWNTGESSTHSSVAKPGEEEWYAGPVPSFTFTTGDNIEEENKEIVLAKKAKEIMVALNKISKTNYDNLMNEIRGCITVLQTSNEILEKSVSDMYSVCIRNMAMGDIVAELYATFCMDPDEKVTQLFRKILQEGVVNWLASFSDIRYVDPEKDNDGFCEYTKKNTGRRCTTKFLLHMVKLGVFGPADFTEWCGFMVSRMGEMLDNTVDNRRNEFEEVTENLFLLVSVSPETTANVSESVIVEDLRKYSVMSIKERPNLTSRAKFKIQDMVKFFVS